MLPNILLVNTFILRWYITVTALPLAAVTSNYKSYITF